MSQHPTQDELLDAIVALRSRAEAEAFFTDLCTPAELEAMAGRWQVAKRVEAGIPYREIHEQTGVSTATVTRVARALTHGAGGYRILLRRTAAGRKGL